VYKCKSKECRRIHSVYDGSVFEGYKAVGKYLVAIYMWATGTTFEGIVRQTKIARQGWSHFQKEIRERMRLQNETKVVGGEGTTVEIDEKEYGKKRKGLRGRATKITLNLWGAVCRETGEVVLKEFDKISEKNTGEPRFGPAKAEEVLPLVQKHIRRGTLVMSDRLRAYRTRIKKMGYKWEGINHSEGPYCVTRNGKKVR